MSLYSKAMTTTHYTAISAPDVHGGFDITHAEVVVFTAETARTYRRDFHFPGQRKLSDFNTQRLVHEMGAGRFRGDVVLAVMPNGTKYIVNGNHTLEAIAKCGARFRSVVTYINVADIAEASALYSTFDNQKVRTHTDHATAAGVNNDHGLRNQGIRAMPYLTDRPLDVPDGSADERSAQGRVDTYNALDRLGVFARLSEAVSGGSAIWATLLAPVMAVAIVTMRDAPKQATVFWARVARDNGLMDGDPAKELLKFLIDQKGVAGRIPNERRVMAAAQAWNAFCTEHKFGPGDFAKKVKSVKKATPLIGTTVSTPAITRKLRARRTDEE